MKILIIGGTRFLGRHIADVALKRGHEITLFNRGKSNPDLFPQAEHLQGDRDGHMEALEGRSWDAVIDTSGYVPRVVRQSAELLKNAVSRYIFISTISVYDQLDSVKNMDENGHLQELEDETTEEVTGYTYGGLKVLCEKTVEEVLPGRALIIRPGFIVGPHDPTFRFSYWISRTAMGGEMLAPTLPDYTMQFIDVRDLAEWIINLAEQQQTGIFHATGQPERLGDILDISKSITESDAQFTWVSEDFLRETDVHLPFWFPSEWVGVHTINIEKAVNNGLKFSPLETIIRDTWAWLQTVEVENPLREGLSRERESELLQKWKTIKLI